ncbi:DNA mismatch repair protein MutS [Rubellimicrobium aerolatum]|uniref:DNA mismatch repair protein MutS n=1 Tax=Rubellimicrobium aerolatum TaxID=490979 RepID=A0ABW0SA66_9RHOB|nr:DNA mismatch repair protein MutS [Rubellimicrobium aerolatum]MBP1805161.1 DNA mismatch repair protein MutS [Rubellimicrobium aerolatum]
MDGTGLETGAATPMMAQFLEIKGRHPDALLFYRMGDFYEMFFEDAEAAAAALDIALTKRGQHLGRDIPMCGVPVATADSYLLQLIRKGFRVAVAEQLEDPAEAKKRGSKSVVKRDVVRLVTPGTLTEEALLEARRANFLCAWGGRGGEGALAWADISTGAFGVKPCGISGLGAELARLAPRELLVCDELEREVGGLAREAGVPMTPLPRAAFDGGARRVQGWFGVATLDGWGAFGRPEVAAMAALLDYLDLTQKGARPHLSPPVREGEGEVVEIDAATRASLELTRALGGGRAGSLLGCIDRTVTAGGARLLEARIAAPSRRLEVIAGRVDAVEALVERPSLTREVREALRGAPDMDRALSRLALDRGGPRDLGALRDALRAAERVAGLLGPEALPGVLAGAGLVGPEGLAGLLDEALVAAPPTLARDGGFVAAGFAGDLDEARRLRDEGRAVIAAMQAEYAAETGVGSLKIRHNGTLGYVVEVTAAQAEKLKRPPFDAVFHHRQTTGSAVRFATQALSETEARLLNAAGEALAIERRIFGELRGAVLAEAEGLARVAAALAEVDVAAALADLALAEGWTRPVLDGSRAFRVTGGRHPVVEAALRREGKAFVANDCDLSERPVRLLTGPNMGGKSTYLRQAALLAVLAQAGSYVPAQRLEMGLVSRLFSRVGASDDLARGRSTFMVEMVETAAILTQADDRSLVLLDEIGRGTATWDGLSIAWAVLEHLEGVNRCRAIFATHYHELATLAASLPGAGNAHVAVADWEGEVVFLHEVREGAADRSYGVQVAKLAGLPPKVVARARAVLRGLEARAREGGPRTLEEELPLFARGVEAEPAREPSAVEERLRAVRADDLSPREALALVYELKGLLGEG